VAVSKAELKVTVFSDYICPFCYVGDARLNRLRASYDLKVNWCFLEIHPETSAQGEPVSSLSYPAETWRRMMATLRQMAEEEQLTLRDHDFTTNSHAALQLAEAAKYIGGGVFYRLHAALFHAFFSEGRNIGDPQCLSEPASDAGMSEAQIASAWQDAAVKQRLQNYLRAARELRVQATPTFFIGERRLDGAVPFDQLADAAQAAF
jgi:predicted DsbA family dithiol-disulfide isomerase